jgi:hypothetical protein
MCEHIDQTKAFDVDLVIAKAKKANHLWRLEKFPSRLEILASCAARCDYVYFVASWGACS